MLDVIGKLLPEDARKGINDLGEEINGYLDTEYAQEIQGCSSKMGVPYGIVT